MNLLDMPAVRSAEEKEPADAPSDTGRLPRAELVTLLALCAVSAAACFFDLGSRSLWNDEFRSALIATNHGTSLWSAVTADGGNMSFYYLLLHVFVFLFGNGQLSLRILSALSGVALTPVIFFLARRMFGSRVAVIASAIVAVSPALVVWDQQARGYCLATLLTASSLLALLQAIECPTKRRWTLYALLAVLSIYTVVYAALFLVAQLLPLAFWQRARRQARPILTAVGVMVLAYIPILVLLLRAHATSVLSSNPPPSTTGALNLLEELGTGIAPDFFATTLVASIVTVVAALCWIAGGTELLSRIRKAPRELETISLGIALSWLFLPLIVDPIFSLAYRSIFDPSFLLQSVPAGALIIAFVFDKLLPRQATYVCSLGFVALLGAALIPTYGVSFEPWAQLSRYVRDASRPGDCLTANKSELSSNLAYYFYIDGSTSVEPRLVLPVLSWSEALDPTHQGATTTEPFPVVASGCNRLWIVLSRVSPGQFLLVNAEIVWFYKHGFRNGTVSRFEVQNGFAINVDLLAR